MEVITQVLSDIWSGLHTLEVPILEIKLDEFLIGLFVVKFCIDILSFLLGKSIDKWEYDQEHPPKSKNVKNTRKVK